MVEVFDARVGAQTYRNRSGGRLAENYLPPRTINGVTTSATSETPKRSRLKNKIVAIVEV